MTVRVHILPLTRQAPLVRFGRSSVNHLPRPVPPVRLAIMRRIEN